MGAAGKSMLDDAETPTSSDLLSLTDESCDSRTVFG
jgi:hypothetical protein